MDGVQDDDDSHGDDARPREIVESSIPAQRRRSIDE
jgi:hypothetical protein